MAGFSSQITKKKVCIQQKGKQNIRFWINFNLIRVSTEKRDYQEETATERGGHSRAHMGMNQSSKQSRAPPRLLTLCPANNPSETLVNTDSSKHADKPYIDTIRN
jgi:hypothetical protein